MGGECSQYYNLLYSVLPAPVPLYFDGATQTFFVSHVLTFDKSQHEYYTKLSDFHAQFRMVGNNYNQTLKELKCYFSGRRTMALVCKLEKCRGLEQWKYDDPRCVQTRAFCKAYIDSAIYREKIKERSDETIANIAITLIHQCDVLIRGLIEWKKRDFKEKGGIKEEMYRARRDWQQRNGYNGRSGDNGQQSNQPNQPSKPIKPSKPKE